MTVCQLLEGAIVIGGWYSPLKIQDMEAAESRYRKCGVRVGLGCRPPARLQELLKVSFRTRTSAPIQGHRMDAVFGDHNERNRARDRMRTEFADWMTELKP